MERTTSTRLEYEGAFLSRQNIHVLIDFTSGSNLYPDLRFCNNSVTQFTRSIERVNEVMTKAQTFLGVDTQFVFSLHRYPENFYTSDQCNNDFLYVLRNITQVDSRIVYLRVGQDGINRPPSDWNATLTLSKKIPNLRLAVNTAWFVSQENYMTYIHQVNAWFVSSSSKDPWDGSTLTYRDSLRNIDENERNATRKIILESSSDIPLFLDFSVRQRQQDSGSGDEWNAEWSELNALWDMLG